jgi:hypothetical protein
MLPAQPRLDYHSGTVRFKMIETQITAQGIMSHIFISYSKQNIDFVRYLRTLLESEGFGVWVDEARLTPSARWWKTIEQNIEGCAAFLVVMSPEAARSDWVEREILLAEKLRRPIFPVLLSGEAWSRLANIQYEDMRAGLRAKFSPHFLNALRTKVKPRDATPPRHIDFTIEWRDVLEVDADVIPQVCAAVVRRRPGGCGGIKSAGHQTGFTQRRGI